MVEVVGGQAPKPLFTIVFNVKYETAIRLHEKRCH